jgi:hypothetical protein
MQYKRHASNELLVEWRSRGYRLVALRDLLVSRNIATLPRHTVVFAEMPGRFGQRMVQGRAFLED